MKKRNKLLVLLIIISIAFTGCQRQGKITINNETLAAGKTSHNPEQETERDEIITLLAYSMVYKDWQKEDTPDKRGHNVGAILVDSDYRLVGWARNCNERYNNGTQHAEVRVMLGHLIPKDTTHGKSLDNYTVYTTLEPCAQCAGMMCLLRVKRVVYGQDDPDYYINGTRKIGYGRAIERLKLDTSECGHDYPYPCKVISEGAHCYEKKELDKQFNAWIKKRQSDRGSLTNFLLTSAAETIFKKASDRLQNFSPQFPENEKVLSSAREFLNSNGDPGTDYRLCIEHLSLIKEEPSPQTITQGKAGRRGRRAAILNLKKIKD
ncbi:MAG: nucleoside deaminase [bacterium]|nr:nucleoside deaminase [bacterium]